MASKKGRFNMGQALVYVDYEGGEKTNRHIINTKGEIIVNKNEVYSIYPFYRKNILQLKRHQIR